MLNVEIGQNREIKRFEIAGSEIDVAAEIGYIVSAIYGQVKAVNPQAAADFREVVCLGFRADSPVWTNPPVLGGGCLTGVIPMRKGRGVQ